MIRRALALLVPLTILGSADAMSQERVDTLKIVVPEHEMYLIVPRGHRPEPPPEDSVEIPPPVDTIPEVPPVDTLPEDSIIQPPIIGDVLTDRPFSNLTAPNWYDRATGNFTIQDDNGASVSPPKVARARYNRNMAGGTAPVTSTYTLANGVTAIEFTFPLKISANWQNHDSGVNKVMYLGVRNQNNENSISLYGCPDCANNNAALKWRAIIHGQPMSRTLNQNVSGQTFQRDRWYVIKVYAQVESSRGTSDGIFKLWANDVLMMNHTDVRFIQEGSNARDFIRVKWAPVWGGTGDRVVENMYMYLDNVQIVDKSP